MAVALNNKIAVQTFSLTSASQLTLKYSASVRLSDHDHEFLPKWPSLTSFFRQKSKGKFFPFY